MISITATQEAIANGNLEQAFELLTAHHASLGPRTGNEVLLLKARYSQYKKMHRMGILTAKEARLERNQVIYALLELLKEMHQSNTVDTVPSSESDVSYTPAVQDVTRILFLRANPVDQTRIFLDKELREIQETLRIGKDGDKFELIDKGAVRIKDLELALLEEDPHIVHFSGHGEEDGIILHGNNDNSVVVGNEALAALFGLFKENVACVFLNSCYSKEQAEKIHVHIPNVIGMSKRVPDTTAIAFSTSFYRALASGRGMSFAFDFAKTSIALHNLSGEDIPVYYER